MLERDEVGEETGLLATIDMKLGPKEGNCKKVQFDLFLENFILLFVSDNVIKFKTIEKYRILKKFIF